MLAVPLQVEEGGSGEALRGEAHRLPRGGDPYFHRDPSPGQPKPQAQGNSGKAGQDWRQSGSSRKKHTQGTEDGLGAHLDSGCLQASPTLHRRDHRGKGWGGGAKSMWALMTLSHQTPERDSGFKIMQHYPHCLPLQNLLK